jgi:hypothetical protein
MNDEDVDMSDQDAGKGREEKDDVFTGSFDETNGVVSGLDGESDGTQHGEDYSAADPEGRHRGFGYNILHWGNKDNRH